MHRVHRKTPILAAAAATSLLLLTGCSSSDVAERSSDVGAVSPALGRYERDKVEALWDDTAISARDRGLVTVATLISNGHTDELGHYVDKALDDGVTPAEISETITHLAFYTGWQNAMDAVPAVSEVFEQHDIDDDDLPDTDPRLLPLDEKAEAERAANVQQQYGAASQGVVDDTRDVLFHDL